MHYFRKRNKHIFHPILPRNSFVNILTLRRFVLKQKKARRLYIYICEARAPERYNTYYLITCDENHIMRLHRILVLSENIIRKST